MGDTTSRPRIAFDDDVGLHFVSTTIEEVKAISKDWSDGPLGLTDATFGHLLKLEEPDVYFKRFDTDNNRKVDLLEVLCVLIAFCKGSFEDKVDALFPVFDFRQASQLSYDELAILIASLLRGVEKVGWHELEGKKGVDVMQTDFTDIVDRIFDSHNLRKDGAVSKEQLVRWAKNDVDAIAFITKAINPVCLPDLKSIVTEKEQIQGAGFAEVSDVNGLASAVDLLRSPVLSETFPAGTYTDLVELAGDGGKVKLERFAQCSRALNAFTVFDEDSIGVLPAVEVSNLYRLVFGKRPTADELQALVGDRDTLTWQDWSRLAAESTAVGVA